MKQIYRNCEIYAKKEKSLGGDMLIYWGVIAPNGFWVEDEFGDVADIDDAIRKAKKVADKFVDEFNYDCDKWDEYILSKSD